MHKTSCCVFYAKVLESKNGPLQHKHYCQHVLYLRSVLVGFYQSFMNIKYVDVV
jgi:hypothetical protein